MSPAHPSSASSTAPGRHRPGKGHSPVTRIPFTEWNEDGSRASPTTPTPAEEAQWYDPMHSEQLIDLFDSVVKDMERGLRGRR